MEWIVRIGIITIDNNGSWPPVQCPLTDFCHWREDVTIARGGEGRTGVGTRDTSRLILIRL